MSTRTGTKLLGMMVNVSRFFEDLMAPFEDASSQTGSERVSAGS